MRAKEVFGVDTLAIISQEFHNRRAIYMAKRNDMDAIAYNAANTTSSDGESSCSCVRGPHG